jgi:hypothetical protein
MENFADFFFIRLAPAAKSERGLKIEGVAQSCGENWRDLDGKPRQSRVFFIAAGGLIVHRTVSPQIAIRPSVRI